MDSEKPTTKNFFVDQKDAKYYKNRFLNNCSMRIKYITRLKNGLVTFNQNLSFIEDLDEKKDPYIENLSGRIKNIRSLFDSILQELDGYSEDLNNEINELRAKDYEEILKKNEEVIREKELKENHTEIT